LPPRLSLPDSGAAGRVGAALLPLALSLWLCALAAPARGEVRVAASVAPIANLAEQLAGDSIRVVALFPPGAAPRGEGDPDGDALRETAGSLLYFKVGSGLEGRADTLAVQAAGPGVVVVDLTEGMDLIAPSKPEETERKIFTSALGLDEASAPKGGNPYFWLDPLLAGEAVDRMAAALGKTLPGEKKALEGRRLLLRERLSALDGEIRERLAGVRDRRLAAFTGAGSYFARRYNLVEIPLTGVRPGGGPGRQSLKGTVSRIRSLGVRAVFTDPLFPRRPAVSAAERAGVRLLTLEPFGTGEHPGYMDMMRHNLRTIEDGLR
jgi:ABC-type Zn uptake system ZnuABC Zn-binding protein ZnuA